MSCVSKLEKAFYGNANIKQVAIDQESGNTNLQFEGELNTDEIESIIKSAGDYAYHATEVEEKRSSKWVTYRPLILIVGYLLLVTLTLEFSSGMFLMETWMANFMAGFFIVFSFFKFLDLGGFAKAYRSYDIIAKKVKFYGYAFPFVELALGISYLLFSDLAITHLITAIIMFVSLVGVVNSVLNKSEIQCACLGTVFNLPMSYVTIIEDTVMLVMALFMYFRI